MTAYIVKTILCSVILILIYYLVLEREKIYRFNRIYLLFSIVFSSIIPLITIKIRTTVSLISPIVYQSANSIQGTVTQQTFPSVNENITRVNFLLLMYLCVTLYLFIRFIVNVIVLFIKIKNSDSVPYQDAKIVLTRDNHAPHSFLKYVFIFKEDYFKGNIEKEIFNHELAHVRQRHSLDILFIELITLFAWINPIIFLYRRAIQLNHEFLADEFVVNSVTSPHDYQLLLLDKAKQPSVLVLSSSFNYFQTKKRIIMMTKKTSFRTAILTQIAIIPIIFIIGFLFSTRLIAQDPNTGKKPADTSVEQKMQTPDDLPSFDLNQHSLSMGFSSWVAKQTKYPDYALKNNLKGWVNVAYTILPDGTISNVVAIAAPYPSLGEAVVKAVKSSPKWRPGESDKSFKSGVTIRFEIPEKIQSSDDIPVYAFGKVPMNEELNPGIEVDQVPQFPNAKAASEEANEEAVHEWVNQHLKYPVKALKAKIEGKVTVRFIVTRTGKLEDFLVTRSASPELSSEAIRVLSLMPDWKPATQEGEPCNVFYHAVVEFKLPK